MPPAAATGLRRAAGSIVAHSLAPPGIAALYQLPALLVQSGGQHRMARRERLCGRGLQLFIDQDHPLGEFKRRRQPFDGDGIGAGFAYAGDRVTVRHPCKNP